MNGFGDWGEHLNEAEERSYLDHICPLYQGHPETSMRYLISMRAHSRCSALRDLCTKQRRSHRTG